MRNTNSLLLNTSRYIQGGVSETQNNKIEWWERTIFEQDVTDRVYVVEQIYEGRLDNISNAFYGEPRYWWVIAQLNNILDPTTEIVVGRSLLVPTRERLSLMLTGRQGGVPSTRTELPIIPPVII